MGISIRNSIAEFITLFPDFRVEGKTLQWWAGHWNMSVREYAGFLAQGYRFEAGIEVPIFCQIYGVDVCLYRQQGQWFGRIEDFPSGRQHSSGTVMLAYVGRKGNLDLFDTLLPSS